MWLCDVQPKQKKKMYKFVKEGTRFFGASTHPRMRSDFMIEFKVTEEHAGEFINWVVSSQGCHHNLKPKTKKKCSAG